MSMSPGPGLAKPADILIRHDSYAYLDAIQRASNSSRVLSLSLSLSLSLFSFHLDASLVPEGHTGIFRVVNLWIEK
jgi:hypothetical protein